MKKPKITKIDVSIPKPSITQITVQSHPEIWELLLTPEDREAKGHE